MLLLDFVCQMCPLFLLGAQAAWLVVPQFRLRSVRMVGVSGPEQQVLLQSAFVVALVERGGDSANLPVLLRLGPLARCLYFELVLASLQQEVSTVTPVLSP